MATTACYCRTIHGTYANSSFTAPTINSTLVAGQPFTLKWDTSFGYHQSNNFSNFDILFMLYVWSGTCSRDGKIKRECRYMPTNLDPVLFTANNTGETVWTPPEGLESRNDYTLHIILSSNGQANGKTYVTGLDSFTILEREGADPFKLPTEEELALGWDSNATTTTQVRATSTGVPTSIETEPISSATSVVPSASPTSGAVQMCSVVNGLGVMVLIAVGMLTACSGFMTKTIF